MCIREDRFDVNSATYDISAVRREWLDDMDELWDARSKKRFFECVQTQYGFDDETVRIMESVYDKLYEKYPDALQKEIDWRFTRLMGGLFYDEGDVSGLKWNDVAGCAIDEFVSVDDYGNPADMTEKDIFQSDEDFLQFWNKNYNRYVGKADYAHQQVTTAAILVPVIRKDGELSNIYLLGGDEKVAEYAGWLGDAVLPPQAFGPEDYKADLDAVNITNLMEKRDLTYQEAVGEYYLQLENGLSRAELFLQDTDLTYVKEKIYDQFVYPDMKEQIANTLTVEERILAQERLKDDEYLMNYLKSKVPATYNFIRSLENGEPEMGGL